MLRTASSELRRLGSCCHKLHSPTARHALLPHNPHPGPLPPNPNPHPSPNPDPDQVRQLGVEGHAYLSDVHRRVREQLAIDFRLPALYSAGMLVTRIWADDKVPDDGMDVEKGHAYWNPHVDKANRASYDYSALLYLNTQVH